jgi:hypothetical protein
MMSSPNRARSHGQPAGLDSSFPEHHGVGGCEFLGQGRQGAHHLGEAFRTQPRGSYRARASEHEFSALHGKFLLTIKLAALPVGRATQVPVIASGQT